MTIQERLARPEGEEQFYINDIKLKYKFRTIKSSKKFKLKLLKICKKICFINSI